MTTAEKAEELILKYSILNDGHNHLVKECALICAKEILEIQYGWCNLEGDPYKYWLAVIDEINKL